MAAAQGYEDGQAIPLDLVLQIASRMCAVVRVPLSLDFEGGDAEHPEDLAAQIPPLLETGVIGISVEDQIIGVEGLFSIADQTGRIIAIRQAANEQGVPLFINARTDDCLKERDNHKHREFLNTAKERAEAYRQAGANGFFAPGLTEPALIKQRCRDIGGRYRHKIPCPTAS